MRSRTATGSCGSPATASSCATTESWDAVRASSWDRTRWRSIRRAGCSSPTDRTTALQIFDKDMNYLDSWQHFGRPSGIAILKDDTLIVADSESGRALDGPSIAPEGGGARVPQRRVEAGHQDRQREGRLAAPLHRRNQPRRAWPPTSAATIFAGLTSGCAVSKSGGSVQKWVRK